MPSFGGGGGGGAATSVDATARLQATAAQAELDTIKAQASTPKDAGDVVWGEEKLWQANKGATTPNPATDANFQASADWDEITAGASADPEVYVSTGVLTGAVPAGAKMGYQIVGGNIVATFYDNGGVWAPAATVTQASQHFVPAARVNATAGVAPTAGETRAAPVSGDTARIELSDGTVEHWAFTTVWGLVSTDTPVAAAIRHYTPDPRANATTGVAPTVGESSAAPLNGDTVRIELSDGVVENWRRDGGAWALVSTEPDFAAVQQAWFDPGNADYGTQGAVSPQQIETNRYGHENFTIIADGGTAEIATGRLVSPGSTIAAPTARPDGTAAAQGDYFQIQLDADGTVTLTGVAETATFTGLEGSTHAWTRTAAGTWIDLDPPIDSGETDALRVLTGTTDGDVHYGAFTGNTIPNNSTGKAALQALETALEALNVTGQQVSPFGATQATLPAVPADTDADTRYWTVQTADEIGTGTAAAPQFPRGIYLSGINQAAGWAFAAEVSGDVLELSATDVTSTTGAPYSSFGSVSAERLDAWGESRRVRRVFNVSAPFDFDALGYSDRTAVFVRNTDNANGINITYGAGGANTRNLTLADGTSEVVAGEDAFNVQPGEICVIERDGIEVYASIFPGERVKRFANYTAANAFGALPHDGLVLITATQEVWARRSNTNGVAFPATGVENADWGLYGGSETLPIVTQATGATPEAGRLNLYPIGEDLAALTAPAVVTDSEYAVAVLTATGYDKTTMRHYAESGGAWLMGESSAASGWINSTDGMSAVDGDKIIVAPNHTINLPGTADLDEVQFAPSTGNWADIWAGTGSFAPDAAWTFGAGQTLPFGSDILTAISQLGNTNWLLFVGGTDVPEMDQRYEAVADLPAPATVNPGRVGVVYNDPTPANNRTYVARTDGVDATVAVAWA